MKQYLIKFEQWLHKLAPRERLLVLALELVLVFMIWTLIWHVPMKNQTRRLNLQVSQAKEQIVIFDEQSKSIEQQINNSPVKLLQRNISELKQSLSDIDKSLEPFGRKTLSPKKIPALVRSIINKTGGLTLLDLTSRPAVNESSAQSQQKSSLARYSTRITLTGGYFDIVKFLQKLASVRWQIIWDDFTLEVTKHPKMTVQLKIYTLYNVSNANTA